MVKQSHIFEGKIREYEKKLVDILIEIGNIRGQAPLISKINSYLFIHGELTQIQLKQLINRSLSTISLALTTLINSGLIKKEFIKGTHTNKYSLVRINSSQDVLQAGVLKLEEISKLFEFLQEIKEELNTKKYQEKQGYKFLLNRISEFTNFLQIFHKIMINSKNSNEIRPIGVQQDTENSPEIIQFDSEIKIIEDKIIEHFVISPIFSIQNRIFSKFTAYFMTRKNLTQEELRNLMELSTGKVSKEVNFLVRRGLIKKKKRKKGEPIIYTMNLVELAFLNLLCNAINDMLKWEDEMKALKLQLENEKEELSTLHGYDELRRSISFFHHYFELIKKLLSKIDRIEK